ncbi:response regulator [Tindallia californiensis]|uniref:Stage 0 sporulation protein A homolog n=1 Tax=Tindallia californiensis TaxID=159292 RepID=A0A1H3PCJ7_9FIRM|nr:response regulator [Tindallia californiensis]SDY98119.1 two-component system, response regulator YcbB [Tindallia californiensis]
MRIFLLDDDIHVLRIIKKIIQDCQLGNVIGTSTSAQEGMAGIHQMQPNLVLIDLLMPEKDGLSIVKELKKDYPEMEFIMISQVTAKEMVGKAYAYGVEYFIHKPVNALEVEKILLKVKERMEIAKTFQQIQSIMEQKPAAGKVIEDKACMKPLEQVLIQLGIMGEKGSQDILRICQYCVENQIDLSDFTLRELCEEVSSKPKSMEQRMRRTVSLAMSNIAHLGIEDFMNETFVKYSSTLFYFEQMRKRMDYIRNKSNKDGIVNIKKFIASLIIYCENK